MFGLRRFEPSYLGPDGLDHPAPTTFRSKTEADRFLTLVEADVARGRWIAPAAGRTTVAEWADRWFASAQTGWKPKTRHAYRSVLDRLVLAHLGRIQLAVLRPIMVSEWGRPPCRRR